MNITPEATFCLWNSNTFEVFSEALRNRTQIRLKCCLSLEGKPVDMLFYGRLRSLEGRDAQFIIHDTTLLPGKTKAQEGSGEFFFWLERKSPAGLIERTGFQGSAIILETGKGPKGGLRYISLRLSRNFTARKMRRDKRVPWSAERSRLAGVALVSPPPATKDELRSLLNLYYKKNPKPIPLIDLSASGACACLPEEIANTPLSMDAIYLFFLVPSLAPASSLPHIFLCKKLGFSQSTCPRGNAVRLRFQEELDWSANQTLLTWTNIEQTGSESLRACLDRYDDGEDDDWLAVYA